MAQGRLTRSGPHAALGIFARLYFKRDRVSWIIVGGGLLEVDEEAWSRTGAVNFGLLEMGRQMLGDAVD